MPAKPGAYGTLQILGRSGLKQYAGYLDEEFHKSLNSQPKRYKAFTEMASNDATIGAVLYATKTLIRSVPWYLKPADESAEADEARQFVDECRGDLSHTWEDFVIESLSDMVHGWALFEIVYKVRDGRNEDPARNSKYTDGRIGWRKFGIRSQDTLVRWEFDDDGGIRGMHQSAPPTYEVTFLPIEKCLLFRPDFSKNNPEGKSLLRNSYRAWFYKKRIEEMEGIRIDRDATGLPKMSLPPEIMNASPGTTNATLRDDYEGKLQKLRHDEYGCVLVPAETTQDGQPSGFKFELIQSTGGPAIDMDRTIRRYQHDIAMTLMAEFMLLGSQPSGTRSLADSKTELFAVALGALMDTRKAVLNRFAIPRLLRLNGIDEQMAPTLEHGDIESRDLAQLGTFVQQMLSVGAMTPDEQLERELRSAAKLPQRDGDQGE